MVVPIGDDQVRGGYFPLFSYGFLVLNILVFLYEISMTPDALETFFFTWGSIPVEVLKGENLPSLFTSMFLHGGWAHLVGNMLFLWIFADNIEATIGNVNFLLFYLLGGLAAHAAHIYFNAESVVPTVGASGAIAAVLGAYLVLFPTSRIRIIFFIIPLRITAWIFLGLWIYNQWMAGSAALEVSTAQSVGIAYWAHIGGFFFGVVSGLFLRLRHRPRYDRQPYTRY